MTKEERSKQLKLNTGKFFGFPLYAVYWPSSIQTREDALDYFNEVLRGICRNCFNGDTVVITPEKDLELVVSIKDLKVSLFPGEVLVFSDSVFSRIVSEDYFLNHFTCLTKAYHIVN